MAKKKFPSQPRIFEERKLAYLRDFAKEAPQIREDLAKDIPAYNELLSLQAQSFEEFAFQQRADELGMPYDANNPPKPTCPHCKTEEKVGTKSKGLYRCNHCGRTFSANHKSISSGTKCDALTWMKVLTCILNAFSINKTCEFCDITSTTYYKIRNRLFYAMQLLLEEVKLYGVIEADNTFVHISYKGNNLRESEFEEDSIFFNPTFVPREARQRGGAYKKHEQNANCICIFTAVDEFGHVLTRFAGVGATSFMTLKHYIPSSSFSLTVPTTDPFRKFFKKSSRNTHSQPGHKSLLVSDKEKAIEKYAGYIGIDFESHVYRKNNKQIALPAAAHNIQRVNALHRRLKEFLYKHHHVSTKYLPGYLVLFEFIENTGASRKAIGKLFKILSTPGFDKPSNYFDTVFAVPNYLEQWLIGDNPLKKIPYNKLLAYYLFDKLKNKSEEANVNITIKDIETETGYTAPTIRKNYRDLTAAGYKSLILEHFTKKFTASKTANPAPKPRRALATVNNIVLAIYDEYAHILTLPSNPYSSFDAFLAEKNKQYGTNYKRTNMYAKFDYIVANEIRPPLQPKRGSNNPLQAYGRTIPRRALEVFQDYEKLVLSYKEKGKSLPSTYDIYQLLGNKHSMTPETIKDYITRAKKYVKTIKKSNHQNK